MSRHVIHNSIIFSQPAWRLGNVYEMFSPNEISIKNICQSVGDDANCKLHMLKRV